MRLISFVLIFSLFCGFQQKFAFGISGTHHITNEHEQASEQTDLSLSQAIQAIFVGTYKDMHSQDQHSNESHPHSHHFHFCGDYLQIGFIAFPVSFASPALSLSWHLDARILSGTAYYSEILRPPIQHTFAS